MHWHRSAPVSTTSCRQAAPTWAEASRCPMPPCIQTRGNTAYPVDGHFRLIHDSLIPNRSLDIGEIARLCHAACFSPSRRRSGLRRGVARNRMRTEAGKMPESLISPIRNGHGVSNDRFGLIPNIMTSCHWNPGFFHSFAVNLSVPVWNPIPGNQAKEFAEEASGGNNANLKHPIS